MLVVAGLSLKNLKPHIWDVSSPYYLPNLKAVMLSYADFCRNPAAKKRAMDLGLHSFVGVPKKVQVFLDNGAYHFSIRRNDKNSFYEYEEFVRNASPDWYPIPQDYIPSPSMSESQQHNCHKRTMEVNKLYRTALL
jgi:hypothetical protein